MSGAAVYDSAIEEFTRGHLDWENTEIKIMLATDAYTPDQTNDRIRADLGAAEVAESGTYTRGGQVLRDRSVSSSAPGATRLLAGNVTWTGFTGSFRYAIIYAADGDQQLVTCTDLGKQAAVNARVTLEYDKEAGVCEFVIAPAI